MQLIATLSLLASAAVGVLGASELGIDVTLPVDCERTTKSGDKIYVHYKGTLQSNGEKFDASSSAPCDKILHVSMSCLDGRLTGLPACQATIVELPSVSSSVVDRSSRGS
jgi:hypothetical protein